MFLNPLSKSTEFLLSTNKWHAKNRVVAVSMRQAKQPNVMHRSNPDPDLNKSIIKHIVETKGKVCKWSENQMTSKNQFC